jgi:hypothetical protein
MVSPSRFLFTPQIASQAPSDQRIEIATHLSELTLRNRVCTASGTAVPEPHTRKS